MNDETRDDARQRSRWWLDPALARLAFGNSTQAPRSAGASAADAMEHALAQGERLALDLDDPAQRDFGDYELLEQIGRGGMGMVYRARQHGLDREVAIKLLSAGQWAPEDLVESLRREAQHAARLQHPNIVVVHDMGEHAGLVYYAMQLVGGRSLSQQLQAEGPMPPRAAARLLRIVAEAVDYAHRLGVLHLDLKPANILVDADGAPRIADFGLARGLEQARDERGVAGTPGYMAPEQAEPGKAALSPATDVWALGAVLYELLTGHAPFEGGDAARTLQLLREGTVRRPSRLAPVPADLEAICLHCLRKDPAQRYPDPRALADDLGRFLEGRAVRARPLGALQRIARWTRREPRLAIVAVLAAAVLLAGVAATSLQWRRAENNASAAEALLWNSRLTHAWGQFATAEPLRVLPPLLANLREQVQAGRDAEATESRIRIGAVLAQSPRLVDLLPAGQPITAVAFDPAGRWVALGTDRGQVQLFDARDGTRRWIAGTADATHYWPMREIGVLAFTRDGRSVLAGRPWSDHAPHPSGHDQVLVDLASGHVRVPPAARCPGFVDASYAPAAGYAVVRCRDAAGRRSARLVRTDDDWTPLGPLQRIPDLGPLWQLSPTRPQAAWSDGPGHVDVSRPGTLDRAFRITLPAGARLRAWTFAPDGSRLALGTSDGRLWLVDALSGRHAALAAQSSVGVSALAYGADGRWLAVSRDNGQAEVWDAVAGRTVADPVSHGDGPFAASVDAASGTLFTADARIARLWQLPRQGGSATLLAAVPVGSPHYGDMPWYGTAAYNAATGLLATRQVDGQARLWRVHPHAAALPFQPPPLLVEHVVDGHRILGDDGLRLQLRDARTLRAVSPPLAFPQPPGLTLPLADGSGVLVASGHGVHLRNLPGGAARWLPRDIANTPVRLLENPRRGTWTASHLAGRAGGSVEVVETFSVATGKPAARVALPGPLDGLRFGGDGRWLFAWRRGVLQVLDAGDLHTLAAPNLGEAPIGDVALDAGGDVLWVSLLETSEPPRLLAIDPRSGRQRQAWTTPGVVLRIHPLPGPGRLALQTQNDGPYLFDRAGAFTALGTEGPVARGVTAISGDGRRLAAAAQGAILVFDTAHGRMLAPPLRLPAMKPGDRIAQLLADAGGEHLLARSLEGAWFQWELRPDATPVALLQRQAELMQPRGATAPATAGERARLRSLDPGPLRERAPSPAYRMRADAPEPRFVDLRPRCLQQGIVGWAKQDVVMASHWPVFPHGQLRLLGEDYDVRCAISAALLEEYQVTKRVDGLRPALRRFATLHVLMAGVNSLQDGSISPYAIVELRYRDGGRARLPVLYRRDVLPWWAEASGPSGPVPALLGREDDWQGDGTSLRPLLYAVALRNPHPDRDVVALALEATPRAWSRPAVLAITLDPVAPAPPVPDRAAASRATPPTPPAASAASAPRAGAARATAALRACATAASACRPHPRPAR